MGGACQKCNITFAEPEAMSPPGRRSSKQRPPPRCSTSPRRPESPGRAEGTQHQSKHDGQYRASLRVKNGGFALKNFAATNSGKIDDFFKLDKQLGEGGFGTVRRGTDVRTGLDCAVKSIKKAAVTEEVRLKEEIEIMRLLDHPNIIRFHESFEDPRFIYLVLELCEGGELFDHIASSGIFTESIAAAYVRQMMLALNYLHQNRIMHRDLKPENFLLGSKTKARGSLQLLKLIDFGLSKRFQPGVPARTKAGTPHYVAPEVLAGRYDEKSDVWSIGVITYIMLSGGQPFTGKAIDDVLQQVKQANASFDSGAWRGISADAKNFVKSLLQKAPSTRPAAAQTLQHNWLQDALTGGPGSPRLPGEGAGTRVSQLEISGLQAFGRMHKLKRAALTVMATQLTEERIVNLRAMFLQMDRNSDGTLSLKELKAGLQQAGVRCPRNLEKMLEEADTDGSGVVDYTEFLAATMDKKLYHQESAVWVAFKKFDLDNSGCIDKNELAKVLGDGTLMEAMHLSDESKSNLERIFAQVDVNGDGLIDFDEFFVMLRSAEQGSAGNVGDGAVGSANRIGIASS